MTDCYYRRLGTDGDAAVFESTDHTRSNWTPEIQYGSSPLALLTKAIEEQPGPATSDTTPPMVLAQRLIRSSLSS